MEMYHFDISGPFPAMCWQALYGSVFSGIWSYPVHCDHGPTSDLRYLLLML